MLIELMRRRTENDTLGAFVFFIWIFLNMAHVTLRQHGGNYTFIKRLSKILFKALPIKLNVISEKSRFQTAL
jgi:hypothetical protein